MTRATRSIVVLLVVALFLSARYPDDKELASRILADSTLDSVSTMAATLLAKGFSAGDGYPQVWIRDFNTFIETSCTVYDRQVIRDNLLTFLRLQQPNNEIVDGYVLKGHVTWRDPNIYTSPNDAEHVGFKNTVETDQETSLIQAIGKYIRVTGDRSILDETIADRRVYQRLVDAVEYLLKHRYADRYGLLTGATTQDWGDMQVEGGAVVDVDEKTHWSMDVYDNAMFVIALRDMETFAPDAAGRKRWQALKDKTKAAVRRHLWDRAERKFIPHVYVNGSPFPATFDERAIWFHGGTAVAIEAGLLSRDEVLAVYRKMVENVRAAGAPSIGLTVFPPYPDGIISGSNSNKPYVYQNGGDWTWFGGRMVQQLVANGFAAEAYASIRPMVDRVVTNGTFHEWYAQNGQPKGSDNFKGEAGVLAKAIVMLRSWAEEHK